MTLTHLPRAGFTARPWKNGLGTTYDIAILPEGAGHNDLDLRFALSPIVEDGIFSSFPDIDRVLTLIEGAGLTLEFDDATHHLAPGQSLPFASDLTPMGRPAPGGVKVVNVMARRGVWHIATCAVTAPGTHTLADGEALFTFAHADPVTVNGLSLSRHDAALATGPGTIVITGTALVAHLTPARP